MFKFYFIFLLLPTICYCKTRRTRSHQENYHKIWLVKYLRFKMTIGMIDGKEKKKTHLRHRTMVKKSWKGRFTRNITGSYGWAGEEPYYKHCVEPRNPQHWGLFFTNLWKCKANRLRLLANSSNREIHCYDLCLLLKMKLLHWTKILADSNGSFRRMRWPLY